MKQGKCILEFRQTRNVKSQGSVSLPTDNSLVTESVSPEISKIKIISQRFHKKI